ncbi:hypothetical protein PLICRDRAFT_179951 [Plicaturopsis crispa FD-325 SS-3]|uniref:Terpenoid synthase n=1 Tax=Plicaturopsis crispa FD-325 SS-3 TaxID=944288 RepID=A0A0C9SQL8_PLICR|nr:hypothetical protein PLICRDRAFT_179951 [Plicaturopsis crispa FD-325 SS-3]
MAPSTNADEYDSISYRQAKLAPSLPARLDGTRDVIVSFLERCSIPYPHDPYDYEFDAATRADGLRRGYLMEGPKSLGPFVPGAVAMATTAYAHLPDKEGQILMCLYTTFLIYLDDVFNEDIDTVREFNERFIHREPQGDEVLDNFADLLLQIPKYFGRVVANIMITSTLNLVTALLLEYETQGMALGSGAQGYPTFSRVMSGASETYALWMFPPELPLRSYIQALPELMIFINNGNDILSFYKEELAGEVVNRVSFIADSRDISKNEALRLLEDEAVAAHDRVVQILAPHKGASEAFQHFKHGYVGFHALAKRYKLDELNL